jgi:hypothetical protein
MDSRLEDKSRRSVSADGTRGAFHSQATVSLNAARQDSLYHQDDINIPKVELPKGGGALNDRRPPRKLPNGETVKDIHGFLYWLWGLQEGCSSLPETMPPELLLAWRNGHVNHPAGTTPVPIRRCEDCLLVLPNASVDGYGPSMGPCPVCGSENISHKKLSGPDSMHIYTPLPHRAPATKFGILKFPLSPFSSIRAFHL